MSRKFRLLFCACFPFYLQAQQLTQVLSAAVNKMENDSQFSHAIISMYVVDASSGKSIYEKNPQFGLAPASCQKIITSASAYELLGKDFRYKTYIGKDATSEGLNKSGAGCLFIIGNGDPTFGSWRWKGTTGEVIFSNILATLKKQKLLSFSENLIIEDDQYGLNPLPDGWVWQDIGNYYGAGCFAFNWHENQFELGLQTGEKAGDATKISFVKPFLSGVEIYNDIITGKAGTGDNGYIYSAPYSNILFTKGTVPLQKSSFVIRGSIPNPSNVFKDDLMDYLKQHGITFNGASYSVAESYLNHIPVHHSTTLVDSIYSPSLDSINYWFMQKSINLFGEAFVKTIALEKKGIGSTDTGVNIIKNFWDSKGIEKSALNIIDGSGLSPANRVTTSALVRVIEYARGKSWFPSFYNSLPTINGLKMKDGYIGGVRSYTGYVKNKSGHEYIFSFIVNNFTGNPGTVREKMWKILDLLK